MSSRQQADYLRLRFTENLSRDDAAFEAGILAAEAVLIDREVEKGGLTVPAQERPPLDPAVLRRLLRYDPDTGALFWKPRTPDLFSKPSRQTPAHQCAKWNGKWAGKEALAALSDEGYRCGSILDHHVYAHRVIWAMSTGGWPPDDIDHIDGDRTNNRWLNIRAASRSENMRNMKLSAANRSGAAGVFERADGRWIASICNRHLGLFDTFEEALAARRAAEPEFGFHPNHGRVAATQEAQMGRPRKAQPQPDQTGEPDFDLAVKIYREEIKPAVEGAGEEAQKASTGYKAIKKQARVNTRAARFVFSLERESEEKRNDVLRSLRGMLGAMNIGITDDLVSQAENEDADEPIIPAAAPERLELATVQ